MSGRRSRPRGPVYAAGRTGPASGASGIQWWDRTAGTRGRARVDGPPGTKKRGPGANSPTAFRLCDLAQPAARRAPRGLLPDDDRAADHVVPAALACVKCDPDDTDEEAYERHDHADEAQDGVAPRDLAAVGVTHDAQTKRHHSDGLTHYAPHADEVGDRDEPADRLSGRLSHSGDQASLDDAQNDRVEDVRQQADPEAAENHARRGPDLRLRSPITLCHYRN